MKIKKNLLFLPVICSISHVMQPSMTHLSRLHLRSTSLARPLAVCANQKYSVRQTIASPQINTLSMMHKRSIVSVPAALACTILSIGVGGTVGRIGDDTFGSEPLLTILGGLFGLGIGWAAFDDTESGIHSKIERKIQSCDKNLLTIIATKQGAELLRSINSYYITHATPLASAFNDLSSIFDKIKQAKELADHLYTETKKTPYLDLSKQCNEKMPSIRNAMNTIKSDPSFLNQINSLNMRRTAQASEINAMANSVNAAANVMNATSGNSKK